MAFEALTKNGYNLFEMSSMIQKAIRRCDIPHAAYAANEMSVKYRAYLWKRLLTVSAEDCYGIMTKEIMALKEADDYVNQRNKPGETNDLFIAKAVVLLCMAKKNRDADYVACNFMWGDQPLSDAEYEAFVDYHEVERLKAVSQFDVPDYVFDVHTRRGRRNGATQMDFFREENEALEPRQMNLFDYGNYDGWYNHQRSQGYMKPNDERRLQKFQSYRGPVDPTNGGTEWTPETYEKYKK